MGKYFLISIFLLFIAFIYTYILGNYFGYAGKNLFDENLVLYAIFYLLIIPFAISPFVFLFCLLGKIKSKLTKSF